MADMKLTKQLGLIVGTLTLSFFSTSIMAQEYWLCRKFDSFLVNSDNFQVDDTYPDLGNRDLIRISKDNSPSFWSAEGRWDETRCDASLKGYVCHERSSENGFSIIYMPTEKNISDKGFWFDTSKISKTEKTLLNSFSSFDPIENKGTFIQQLFFDCEVLPAGAFAETTNE